MSDAGLDPVVRDLRGEISELDRAIVAAVNVRLELVARLKRYKESHGLRSSIPSASGAWSRSSRAPTRGRCRRRACASCMPRCST